MNVTAEATEPATEARKTPLYDVHRRLGAKMVTYAGFSLPVSFAGGIIKEHLHTRDAASLFDVSHMGQAHLNGPDHDTLAHVIEMLCPAAILELKPGRQRYSQLLNSEGGIIDDLMIARPAADDGNASDARLMLVVNASRRERDFQLIRDHLPAGISLDVDDDRALLALQGPEAAAVLARHCPKAGELAFMDTAHVTIGQMDCHISRGGYSGEDGYEISVGNDQAVDLAELLLAEAEVEMAGLGARDSLRLEAGLCLYGNDIDETTSPIEAGLAFSIGKRRRSEGGFPGAHRILTELKEGPRRKRIGLTPQGRAPVREGQEIADGDGRVIGGITSGLYGPSVGGPVAMGYVESEYAQAETEVIVRARGGDRAAHVTALPFVPHRYHRAPK